VGRSSVVGIVTLAGVEVVRMAVESWVSFYCRMSLSVAHCGSVSVVMSYVDLCRRNCQRTWWNLFMLSTTLK
jgi:hypothetical protein